MSDATTIDAGGQAPDAAALATRAYLVVRAGGGTQLITLDDGADILFGRSPEATVRLDDGKVSREHARVTRRGRTLTLVELGSRNGTRLNDELLRGESRGLRSGDVVRIGDAEVLVAEGAGVAAGGSRLAGELARLRAAGDGRVALLRVTATAAELAELAQSSGLLAAAELVEAQPDGGYACLLADPAAGEALLAALQRAAPGVAARLVRAPEDGVTAEALWQRAATATGGRAEARAAAARRPWPVLPGVVVADAAMARVFELVRKVAAAPTTVLILGETGVGKEVIAEQIHRQSPRAAGPFVRLNCGSLPETLLESELFGHEKGAFTGADRRKQGYLEAAHGGTLFLDEIGELALGMQAKLLRVLEDRRFMRVGGREEISSDLRIVAATNRNLEAEAKTGRFREDLYFRLSAFVVRVPPLRERPAEIPLLAELFARQFAQRMNVAPRRLSAEAMETLARHGWPGNVRELRNAMEHAVVLADDRVVTSAELPETIGRAPAAGAHATAAAGAGGPMRAAVADMERRAIQEALDAEDGNQTRAAKRLGISRRALQYKLEKYRKPQ